VGQGAVVVAVPAQAGPVDGTAENLTRSSGASSPSSRAPVGSQPSPVVFETWASDADTFPALAQTARWPAPNEPKKFNVSTLAIAKQLPTGAPLGGEP
jgi:hypothetical protein